MSTKRLVAGNNHTLASWRLLAALALLAGTTAVSPALAQGSGGQEKAKAGAAGAQKPGPEKVGQTTEVKGEIPQEFLGRWVAFATIKLPSGAKRYFAQRWEVHKGREHYEIDLKGGSLPTAVMKKLNAASATGEDLKPAPEDVSQVRDQWDDLGDNIGDVNKVENKLLAAPAYPDEFTKDATTKGSDYAIVFNQVFSGKQSVLRTYSIYAVRNRQPGEMSGSFITTSTALAPFPIPITLKGDFVAYRAGEPPQPSLWQRFMDMFAGCGN